MHIDNSIAIFDILPTFSILKNNWSKFFYCINMKVSLFFFLFLKIFFNFIFGCVGSSLLHAGFLQLWRVGATLHCGARASHCSGFSCCRAWPLGTQTQQLWLSGSRVQAQQLWCTGLAAPRHVGSSQNRARTRVPYIGRRILNHCTTREGRK